jgi:hypothetical protein
MDERTAKIYRAAAAEDWQTTAEIEELLGDPLVDLLVIATTLQAGIWSEEVARTEEQGVIRWRITSRGKDALPKAKAKAKRR